LTDYTPEELKLLKYHYQNLMNDTDLLVKVCGDQKIPISEGFKNCKEKLELIEKEAEKQGIALAQKPQEGVK
jgi:hypothetical protein